MFRFMKECVQIWVKWWIGDLIITLMLLILAFGVLGGVTIISAAIKYLGS